MIVCLVCLGIYGGFFIVKATENYGMGMRTDSIAYVWAARTFASGGGLGRPDGMGNFKPLTHWPPLYPILLAGFEWLGIGAVSGARILGVAMYVAIILLTGCILARASRSVWAPILAALVCAISPTMLETSVMAMTEPLYIAISLATLLTLSAFFDKRRTSWLLLSGFLAGMALLTRYVGLAIIVAGGIILLIDKNNWKEKIKNTVFFGSVACLPMGGWVVRNLIVASSSTNRHLTFYPVSSDDYSLLWDTLSSWARPAMSIFAIGSGKLLLGSVAVILTLWFFYFKKNKSSPPVKDYFIILLNIIYGLCYTGMLFLSRFFFDPAITVWEPRMLAPLFIVLVILIFWLLDKVFFMSGRVHSLVASVVVLLTAWSAYTFSVLYLDEANKYVQQVHDNGASLSVAGLRETPFIQSVMSLPTNTIVFTTNVEAFYYFTGRNCYGYQAPLTGDWVDFVNEIKKTRAVLMVNFFRDDNLEETLKSIFPEIMAIYEDGNGIIYSTP